MRATGSRAAFPPIDGLEAVGAWLGMPEKELVRILGEYGEERYARRIAKGIVRRRAQSPILTTLALVEVIREAVPPAYLHGRLHFATRTFQALRIAVNHELESLEPALRQIAALLRPGGRLVVLAFHSLEDRIIKQSFAFLAANCRCPKQFQTCQCGGEPFAKLLTKKPITPSPEELNENPASRSAKLRVLEKLKGPAPRNFWKPWLQER